MKFKLRKAKKSKNLVGIKCLDNLIAAEVNGGKFRDIVGGLFCCFKVVDNAIVTHHTPNLTRRDRTTVQSDKHNPARSNIPKRKEEQREREERGKKERRRNIGRRDGEK